VYAELSTTSNWTPVVFLAFSIFGYLNKNFSRRPAVSHDIKAGLFEKTSYILINLKKRPHQLKSEVRNSERTAYRFQRVRFLLTHFEKNQDMRALGKIGMQILINDGFAQIQ